MSNLKDLLDTTQPSENKRSMLLEAHDAVESRRAVYGSPKEDFDRIAALWTAIFNRRVSPHEVALCMIAVKVSRAVNSNHADNYVDIAGYADCGYQVDNRDAHA